MRRSHWVLLSLLVVGGLVPNFTRRGAAAQSPPIPRPVGPTGVVLPPSDPMASEMQRVIDRHLTEYARLFTQLAQARKESEAFAVQEDLRQTQVALQVSLLRIQSAYARRAGRERLAWQLERAIEELITPESSRIRQQGEANRR